MHESTTQIRTKDFWVKLHLMVFFFFLSSAVFYDKIDFASTSHNHTRPKGDIKSFSAMFLVDIMAKLLDFVFLCGKSIHILNSLILFLKNSKCDAILRLSYYFRKKLRLDHQKSFLKLFL